MNNHAATQDARSTTSEAAARAAIIAWSADRPAWQRDALRRLYGKDRLDEADLSAAMALCKSDTAAAVPIDVNHIRDPGRRLRRHTLQSLHSIKHVNALADGAR